MMHTRYGLHGLSLVEIVIILVAIGVLVSIPLTLFTLARRQHGAREVTCLSRVRIMSTACAMYEQDNNGRYPGKNWASEIAPYLDDIYSPREIFLCPYDDGSNGLDSPISYGYNGLLVQTDGTGVEEKQIIAPTEVGTICDAQPAHEFPNGGLINPTLGYSDSAVLPAPRHSGGTVVGYADGHAKYVPNGFHTKDLSNGVNRAFILASALGLVDNPVGGMPDFTPAATNPAKLALGGDPCTAPILRAAAAAWRQKARAPIVYSKFLGQYATKGRAGSYLWGIGDGEKPAGPSLAIARDAVVVIIAKTTKIPPSYLSGMENGVYTATYPQIRTLFANEKPDVCQPYTFNTNSGTRRFFTRRLGVEIGQLALVVHDDWDMVDHVANDPYGIGYCSSAIADPERVQVIGLKTADGTTHYFPQADAKYRWIMPNQLDWPLTRTLYVAYGGQARTPAGDGIVNALLAPTAPGTRALHANPLFKASYLTP